MKIKFLEPIELEQTCQFDASLVNQRVFETGEEVSVRSVVTNENYRTATITWEDYSLSFGVPMATFEVKD